MNRNVVLIAGLVLLAVLIAGMIATNTGALDFLLDQPSQERQVYIVRDVFIDLNQDGHPDLLLYGEVILDEGGTIAPVLEGN